MQPRTHARLQVKKQQLLPGPVDAATMPAAFAMAGAIAGTPSVPAFAHKKLECRTGNAAQQRNALG